jgi:hypothetical protein
MKQYALTGKFGNQCTFTYNEEGWLVDFKAGDVTGQGLAWILFNMPVEETKLVALCKTYPGFTLAEIPVDLTFDTFWEAYDYKLGGKKRAEKLWNALPDADKARALTMIGRYNRWLATKNGIQKCNPETYLNQRRFENVFK